MKLLAEYFRRSFILLLTLAGLTNWLALPIFTINVDARRAAFPAGNVSSSALIEADRPERGRVAAAYVGLPLSFEAASEQADRSVKFISRGGNCSVFLGSAGAVMRLPIADFAPRNAESQFAVRGFAVRGFPDPQSATIKHSAEVRMSLVGANASARVVGLDELESKSNYFIGSDPKKWRANVPNYSRVKWESVYAGVDMVFHGNQQQLEYDFIVAPGATYRAISIQFSGADKVRLVDDGDLVVETAAGEVRQRKPVIYQQASGMKHFIGGGYVMRGDREVGFELGDYDPSLPIVIDPVLVYSMRFGGSYNDTANAIAIDDAGNAYITGTTDSLDFPTLDAFQPNLALSGAFIGIPTDVFVAKLNTSGTLVYSTYLGGGNRDAGLGISVDSAGNAYATGFTPSPDFPTTPGAFQTSASRDGDAFITKLNPAGNGLIYSTRLGGPSGAVGLLFPNVGKGIAVDADGSAYVTGYTFSASFPTRKAAQAEIDRGSSPCCSACFYGAPPAPSPLEDAFVTKLNPSGTGLIYSTYLGGTGQDEGFAIAVDSSGSAYVTGRTCSRDFTNALFGGGISDAFLVKLSPSGKHILYSRLLGGSGDDVGNAVAVDSGGNAYIAGQTDSLNFPTSEQAFQPRLGGSVSYSSPDGAGSWSAANGLPNAPVNEIAVDPGSPLTIYAGLGSCRKGGGIFKSTDGAVTWRLSGFADSIIQAVAVDPKQSSIVFADNRKSTDAGATWTFLSGIGPVGKLIIDPLTPSTIYANINDPLCSDAVAPQTLQKSTDAGATWSLVRTGGNPFIVSSFGIDPKNPSTLYATNFNLNKSTDGGNTWRVQSDQFHNLLLLAIDPTNPLTLYFKNSSSLSILKSTDGGISFRSVEALSVPINALAVDPTKSSIVYAATGSPGNGGGVFKSVDGGLTWALADLKGITVNTLTINPLNTSQIHAGTVADVDSFVVFVNPAGGVQSTYLGGRAHDFATGIGIDASSNLYVTGRTFSDLFPTRDALQASKTSSPLVTAAFVTKLRQGLDAIDYSTYFAGDEPSFGTGIAVNAAGNAYGTGAVGAFRPVPTSITKEAIERGGVDAFVVKIISAPRITNVEISGKNLLVIGEGFDRGALVLINGVAQRTRSDPALPTKVLIAKKGGTSMAPGQTVTIHVRSLDQTLSDPFVFTRPANN